MEKKMSVGGIIAHRLIIAPMDWLEIGSIVLTIHKLLSVC